MGALDDALASPEMRMATLLSRADRARRAVEHRQALGTADLRLLWLLGDGKPRTMRDVAEQLGLEQSTVNRQVGAALRNGYVRRTREHGSSAAVHETTEAGAAVLRRDVEIGMRSLKEGLGSLGADDAARLIALLGRFFDAYEASLD